MKFEKLTRKALIKLKSQGFNMLFYNIKACELSVTWFPLIIENIYEYIIELSYLGEISFEQPNIMIIDHEILNTAEEDLYGYVFLESYN